MRHAWRSFVVIALFVQFEAVFAQISNPINFSVVLVKTVKKFQLQGQLFAIHVLYIVLGFISILFMFGLSIILLSEHGWCKKKEEEDAKTMELVPHDIFEVHHRHA